MGKVLPSQLPQLLVSKISDKGSISHALIFVEGESVTVMGSFCRICYSVDKETDETLVSPCNCRGTAAHVHLSCLEQWLVTSNLTACEICGYVYTLKVESPSFRDYLHSCSVYSTVMDVIGFLLLVALVIILNLVTFILCSDLWYRNSTQLALIAVGTCAFGVSMVFTSIVLLFVQASILLARWRRWRDENPKSVRVLQIVDFV